MPGISILLLTGAIGAVAQVIDGSLGMGFGVFSASLMIATGVVPAVAVAAVNAAKIFTGLASGVSHWSLGNVRRDWLLPLALGGVVGGVMGAYLLTSLPPEKARPWVSLLLVFTGGFIIWRSVRSPASCAARVWNGKCADCPQQKLNWQRLVRGAKNHPLGKLGALGFVAAFVNGLSGAFGPLATSGVMLIEKGQPRYAVGTVNLAEVFVAVAVATTILARQGLAQFPISLVIALSIGGTLVAPLSAYICRRFPARALSFLVGAAMVSLNFWVVVPALIPR